MRPIGIDLFSGAGGFSLGFEQAGFDVAAAVDMDPVHCAVHKFNFPRSGIIPHPVEAVTANDIRDAAGIGNQEIDCAFGGAPCQGFSAIGKHVLDDPRNKLARHFVRLVTELGARTFVFENVKGLASGKNRIMLDEFVSEFEEAGYCVRSPWRVLNAGNYGAPQCRERLILLGARKGQTLPDYPEPATNISGRSLRIDALPDGPSCADALADLPDADRFRTLNSSDSVETIAFGTPSTYAARLRGEARGAWRYGYVRKWNPALLTSSARTQHTAASRQRFADTEPGSFEPISHFFKLAKDGVSNTLRAGTDGSRGAFTSPRPIHYRYNRCITVREMARLHGFPDWFRLHVTKWHGARQIGNAVPPPLARAIASEIVTALGRTLIRPKRPIALGDPELLSFGLGTAAAHFGVEPPPIRRSQNGAATED